MGNYGKSGRTGPNILLLVGMIGLIAAGLGGGYYWLSSSIIETDAVTGCQSGRAAPEAMLVLIDQTDKLTKGNAERIRTHIIDRVKNLPRYSRVLIVPFNGDVSAPLKPIFDHCVPGKAEDGGITEGSLILKQKYVEFEKTLDGMVDQIQKLPDSKTSPIAEQVVRAASDSVLHWDGDVRSLYLITDGLESSIYWTKELHLQEPPHDILRDVRAEYFEVGNARNGRLQTKQLRDEWRSWLEKAGAEVRIDAPGYPASPDFSS